MKYFVLTLILTFSFSSVFAKGPGKLVLSSQLGSVTVFNQWIDGEPINEPFQLFVTVNCKKAGKGGKKKFEVVKYWSNCKLDKYDWDKYSGLLKITVLHNNEKTDYKECSYRDKRELKVSDYCVP